MGRKSRSKREKRAELRSTIAAAARGIAAQQADPEYAAKTAAARSESRHAYARVSVFRPAPPPLDADADWLRAVVPAVPEDWVVVESAADGWLFQGPPPALLKVMVSGHVESDGCRWVHGSASAVGRVPTWAELVATKELFAGPGRLAVMVIPPRAEYVNIHDFVLHWWVNVDRRPLPDFTRGSGTI